jgi:hypothetical protein
MGNFQVSGGLSGVMTADPISGEPSRIEDKAE